MLLKSRHCNGARGTVAILPRSEVLRMSRPLAVGLDLHAQVSRTGPRNSAGHSPFQTESQLVHVPGGGLPCWLTRSSTECAASNCDHRSMSRLGARRPLTNFIIQVAMLSTSRSTQVVERQRAGACLPGSRRQAREPECSTNSSGDLHAESGRARQGTVQMLTRHVKA